MLQDIDPKIIAWVSANLIPFEAELRTRLRRSCASTAELDDLIQDIYYRILKMEDVEHVRNPHGFVMQTAKNIVIDRLRHEAVVDIEAMANLEDLELADDSPSTERVAMARAELRWVLGLIGNLPERCRQVFSARRIYGMSQQETAASVGCSENIVEKENMRGLKLISDMISRVGPESVAAPPGTVSEARKRNVQQG